MKKEYLFFLVLVLAAAIITGATIGFISNFHHIQKQAQENLSQVQTTEQQTLEQGDGVKDENANPEDEPLYNDSNEIKKVTVSQPAAPTTEQGYLVLSGEEKQQIVDMLVSLGATKDGDYSAFIRNFQKEKSLPPTGNLDSLTLNAVIYEVTKQRAAQIVNG